MSSPAEAWPCGSCLAELLLVRLDILLQVRHPRNVAAMGHRGIVQVAAVGRVQVVAGLFMAVEVPALHQLAGSIGEAAAGFLGWIGMALLFGMAERLTVERSEEHTSELQSLMRISYAVFCLKKKKQT